MSTTILPSPDDLVHPQRRGPAVAQPSIENARVLVVDDEPGIRDMLSSWVVGAGYDCDVAGNADEALACASRSAPAVALLDIALPGRDGMWLARALREQHRDAALLMVTGLQRFDVAVEGMRLGVLDYLLKPFTRTQMVGALRSAMESRERGIRTRLENEQLRTEIASRTVELSDAFTAVRHASAGALDALLVTLHTRNPEACAHARRVAEMATRLAKAMGVEEPDLSETTQGALLHDIGKVAMPDSLIHKAGKLTDDEIAIIRTHARLGHDIIAAVPALRGVARIVLHSHESWDGTGYPGRLAGEQIPIGSRITAVVDTFDALTYGRIYRSAVPFEHAAAELRRCAGTQFDPVAVYVWLTIARQDRGLPAA